MKRERRTRAAVAAAFVILAAGFALPRASAGESTHVLRVRSFADPPTFDWQLQRSNMEVWLVSNLMEGLVRISPKGKALPALATRWTVSPDQKTWTFTLRKGVLWSDGVPLKAQDFVSSWERLLAPTTYSSSAAFAFDIVNAEAFHTGAVTDFKDVGVRALNDSSLEVKLRSPMSDWYWYTSLTGLFPIRQDLIRRDPMGWSRPGRLVTLGPFTLQSFDPGHRVVLVQNPRYYGKHGNLVEIEYSIVPDDEQAVKLFDEGRLDFVPKLARATVEKRKGQRELASWADLRLLYLLLNAKVAPTSDVRVRRAIAQSLDRARLAPFLGDECAPSASLIPAPLEGARLDGAPRFDAVAAKKALQSSSFPQPKNLKVLAQNSSDGTGLARFVEEEVGRNLGLPVALEVKSAKDYYSVATNHAAYPIDVAQWTCDFPDPDDYLMVFLGSGQWTHDTWSNAEYDRLVVAARSYPSKDGREKAYKRALQILLNEEVIAVPLCHGRLAGLVSKRVKGFEPGPMTWWIYRDLSVD